MVIANAILCGRDPDRSPALCFIWSPVVIANAILCGGKPWASEANKAVANAGLSTKSLPTS